MRRIGGKAWKPADILPILTQRFLCFAASTAIEAVGQNGGIHRARAGAADADDVELRLFEQAIENAPGEGAVRAAALERNCNMASFHRGCALRRWQRRLIRSVTRLHRNLPDCG